MKLLVLNGSPRKQGTVATLLRAVADGARQRHEVEWIDVYDLTMKPCRACMKCRPDGECCFPEDDAHLIGRKLLETSGLIVGTPTYWGNMSSPLKVLFDRIVPVLMGERPSGIPTPRHKGKPAIIATACTTPWPLSLIPSQGRGAIRAVREVLHYGGYKTRGTLVMPGTRRGPSIPRSLLAKARALGSRL